VSEKPSRGLHVVGQGTPRPKGKVQLAADRLPEEARKFLADELGKFTADAEIARQVNARWPDEVKRLYRGGMRPKHVGAYRRHRFESLRERFSLAGQFVDSLAKQLGLPAEKKEELRHEVLHRLFFAGIEKASDADLAVLLRGLENLERLKLGREKLEMRREALKAHDPREIYLAATEELLKRLRTRKALREALDPIQKELIEELSKSAESFAKRIEAQSAG